MEPATSPALTLDLIRVAEARIRPLVHRTPVATSRTFDDMAGRRVFFKCENFQRAGAFKMRGATNKILSLDEDERAPGVVAFSSGNHAQAVAFAARDAGVRAVIVMPTEAPRTKLAATRGYGAEVVTFDRQLEDREEIARRLSEREGLTVVPPFDDYVIIAGQGTCALELLEDVPDLDALLTPCGGGGLFAGASTAAKALRDRKSTRLNSSHANISYAVFCLKKKNRIPELPQRPQGPDWRSASCPGRP